MCASVLGVERADSDEAMHADFAGEFAEGKRPCDPERDRADARFFAGRDFKLLEFEFVLLEVSSVHSKQHTGPVAAFRAACAGVNAEEAVAGVVRP